MRLRPVLISAAVTLLFALGAWVGGLWSVWQVPLNRVPSFTWIGVVGGMLLSYSLRAWRIRREFAEVAGLSGWLSLRIVLTHTALVNLLPMRSGELGFPWLMRRALQVSWLDASASLLWLRLQDACVLTTLALWVWPQWPIEQRLALTLALWIAVLCGIHLVRRHGTQSLGERTSGLALLTQALSQRGQRLWQGWLITTANWALKLTVQAWLLAELLQVTLTTAWAGSVGAELSALLPLQGLGGVGSYEAGSAAALRWHGVAWADGLQAALSMHLCLLACSLGFGCLAWWLPRPLVSRHNPG